MPHRLRWGRHGRRRRRHLRCAAGKRLQRAPSFIANRRRRRRRRRRRPAAFCLFDVWI